MELHKRTTRKEGMSTRQEGSNQFRDTIKWSLEPSVGNAGDFK
jgi:hypothetical protein